MSSIEIFEWAINSLNRKSAKLLAAETTEAAQALAKLQKHLKVLDDRIARLRHKEAPDAS